jgi:hypothetical protein
MALVKRTVAVLWPCPSAGCTGNLARVHYQWVVAKGPQMHRCPICLREERARDDYDFPGVMQVYEDTEFARQVR